MQNILFTATLVAIFACGTGIAKEPLRVDASSDAAAEASWRQMFDSASPKKQRQLITALIDINLIGVNSAGEAMDNPELDSLGIVRIKDKVAGLTADEIIDFAKRTSTGSTKFQDE